MIGKKTSKGRQTALSFFKGSALSALRKAPVVMQVYETAREKGLEVFLVGGVLRNIALKSHLVPDYDFILEKDVSRISARVAERLGGTSFLLDKETLSYRVVADAGEVASTIDFSPIKAGGVMDDLGKRDFTVNAMAVNVADLFEAERPPIIDPFGGIDDAGKKIIRAVYKGVFKDDPIRVLRAIRLSQQYSLDIDLNTRNLICRSSGLLKNVAAERVRDELILIFLNAGTPESLRFIFDCGAARAVFPGLEDWKNINGYDLLSHALTTVHEAESLLNDVRQGKWKRPSLERHFKSTVGSINRAVLLKMASFFHDIGKPYAASREDGRLRFTGHDFEGSRKVKDALNGLKFSRKASGAISNLVKNHHRVFTLAALEAMTLRSKAHFFRAVEGEGGVWKGAGVDLVCLALSDARATRGGEDPELLKAANELLDFYYATYIKKKPRPILSGNEIMKAFNIPEGRLVGEVIGKISEGIEKGIVKNRKEAIAYLKEWFSRKAQDGDLR